LNAPRRQRRQRRQRNLGIAGLLCGTVVMIISIIAQLAC